MTNQVGSVDQKNQSSNDSSNASGRVSGEAIPKAGSQVDGFKPVKTEMSWPDLPQDALAAALEAMQRIGIETDAENAVEGTSMRNEASGRRCSACGAQNREANKFCAMCGAPLRNPSTAGEVHAVERARVDTPMPAASGQHQYHHHYHHHFFSTPSEAGYSENALTPRPAKELLPARAPLNAPAMSRAEAAIRKQTQALALACNSKQLDDLVDVYAPDALLLRPNTPPVRGSAAIREHFFGLLESGFGEVELDPLRVEIVGEMAYEAGRCKMLVPFAMGKRREERGKYLMVYNRRSSDEWKVMVDCWSSDLSLGVVSEPEPKNALSPRPGMPRKSA
jgi:ketosteroid isomerase-like protein